jgi:hypothetical protein
MSNNVRTFLSRIPHNSHIERRVVTGFLAFLQSYLHYPPADEGGMTIDFFGCYASYEDKNIYKEVGTFTETETFKQGLIHNQSLNAMRGAIEAAHKASQMCAVRGIQDGGIVVPSSMDIKWSEGQPITITIRYREVELL